MRLAPTARLRTKRYTVHETGATPASFTAPALAFLSLKERHASENSSGITSD
jgi:hypothetical protein